MTFSKKFDFLDKLPKHKMTYKGTGARYFDLGSLRPWDKLSIKLLGEMIREDATPIDIAYITRRDYHDVLAMCRIYKKIVSLHIST
ncbi:MAG: hypothetical protein QGH40_11910 [bacterium]|nr:hypothetical protein [bacterium]